MGWGVASGRYSEGAYVGPVVLSEPDTERQGPVTTLWLFQHVSHSIGAPDSALLYPGAKWLNNDGCADPESLRGVHETRGITSELVPHELTGIVRQHNLVNPMN